MLTHKRPRLTRLSVEPLEERRLLSVVSFQDGVSPTADYAGTRDVSLFGAEDSTNFGDATTLRADAEQGSTGEPVWSLIKWDLSGIPATATINDVSITVNVTNTTVAPGFNLLAMRTDWIESEATWIGPTSTSTWEEPGVTDPSDFNPTVLGTMTGTATGPLTVLFNSAGRAVVVGWLSDPASNHGFLLSNPANSNSLRFDSREATTRANRPKLSIDFTFNDVDPPTATLIDPLDNGPADQDDDVGEVRVGVRDSFVIGLDDFALDDATVTAETLSITKDAAAFSEFTFAFDAAADQITLTPTAGSFGQGSYNVTLNGGAAKIADATGNILPRTVLTIVIDAGLPTTPVAEDDTYETAEDTPLVADPEAGVLDNDFGGNAPGDAVLVSGPSSGTLALNPDGSFTYTPADNFTGQDSFTYTLETPLFTSNVATATIDVRAQSPITSTDKYNGLEDELLVVDATSGVLANDSDPQGDEMTAVLSRDVREGTLTLNPDGSFTYQPNENFFGPDSFRYRASDGEHESPSTLVQITIENVNDPPVAVDDEYVVEAGQSFATLSRYERLILDSQPLGYWRLDEAVGASAAIDSSGNGNDGTYVGDVLLQVDGAPAVDGSKGAAFDRGTDHLLLPSELLDGLGDVTVEFWFNTTDTGPQAIVSGAGRGAGEHNEFLIFLNSELNNLELFYTGNGLDEFEEYSIPSIADGQWHHYVFVRNDTDNYMEVFFDGQSIGRRSATLSPLSIAPGGLIVGEEQDSVGGTFSGSQAMNGRLDELAIYSRVLTAADVQRHFAPAGFDSAGVLDNDVDIDGDEVREAILVDDVQHGTLQLEDDGSFTYTPDEDFVGVDTFTYVASDGQTTSNEATVTLTVDFPPTAEPDAYEVDEHDRLVVDAATGVLANDSDVENQPLRAQLVGGPQNGTLELAEDGSFVFVPDDHFFGTDSFTYRANDGLHVSNVATATITVNEALQTQDDSYTIQAGETLVVDAANGVTINDEQFADPFSLGNILLVITSVGRQSLLREFTPQGDLVRSFAITPDSGPRDVVIDSRGNAQIYNGTFSPRLTTVDGRTGKMTQTTFPQWGTVNNTTYGAIDAFREFVYVTDMNTAGGAARGVVRFNVNDGTAVRIVSGPEPIDLDIGLDGFLYLLVGSGASGNTVLKYDPITGASLGSVRLSAEHRAIAVDADGNIFAGGLRKYDPRGNLIKTFPMGGGVDVNISRDGRILTADRTGWWLTDLEMTFVKRVGVTVHQPSYAGAAFVEAPFGRSNTFLAQIVDQPLHGSAALNADGSFTYTPNPRFAGIDTFTYRISNGEVDSIIGTVTINVERSEVPADLTGNGFVDFEDLTVLLAAWNQNVSAAEGNLVDAGSSPVNFEDLTVLLAAWTGPGAAGAPVGRRLAAAVGGDSVGDFGGADELVAVGDASYSNGSATGVASYRRRDEAPRQAAAYGSATGVASYRERRGALGRLQAVAVDVVWAEEGAPRRARIRAAHELRRQP
ncbi:MAG: tandem-95 repeat protein [Planctomycetes bacterium]|nr:tandem-95 repeat protein [Planctomycetota bacterium]